MSALTDFVNNTQFEPKRRFELPYAEKMRRAQAHFSFVERSMFYVLIALLCISAYTLFARANTFFTTEVPVRGSSLSEGIIGSPRFINPLLAISDADRDLTALVYSGLMKATPEGTLVEDAAQSYSISEDGLTYDFLLKPNLTFHDGAPLNAEDVAFTILKAQDAGLKSPRRASWEGVEVQVISDLEIRFVLNQPYAPFLENTTLRILPKHLWENVDNEAFPFSSYNFDPVGSGPFRIANITRDNGGIPKSYTLVPFENYALGEPYLASLTLSFFGSMEALEEAYLSGDIEAVNGIAPERVSVFTRSGAQILSTPLPRIFGVFFNQDQATLLADKTVRAALDLSAPREAVVQNALGGYGEPITTAVPSYVSTAAVAMGTSSPEARILEARALLEDSGWVWSEEEQALVKEKKDRAGKVTERSVLTFSIATGNVPELRRTAEILKDVWGRVGARVEVQVFETGDLNQNVIRPRKYDALLFGMVVGRDLDLFAFWHSSQRNDPGLNVSLYTNSTADKLLAEARALSNYRERLERYQAFSEEVREDIPAVFLYAPEFIYVLPSHINGVTFDHATIPSERFLSVERWYIETESVWDIFAEQ